MYLASLKLQNFRSFKDAEIPLCRDLTVLVGENNGGKSNAIDAIRLLTQTLNGRREIYCEYEDVRFKSGSNRFLLEATYKDLSPAQQGRLISAASDETLTTAVFGLEYEEAPGSATARPKVWAGWSKGQPEPGCLAMVRHVYLPPLRDARKALASGNVSRIHALLKHFLDGQSQDDVARTLARSSSAPILGKVAEAVNLGLTSLTAGVRPQHSALSFSQSEKLGEIARDLRFRLADQGISPEELRHTGHGYANLLYMATIAVELERVEEADLTIFLVEEPEAHLHPQLQAAVLGFLEDKAEASRKHIADHSGFAGELQIVVATHSPNLSAWVDAKNIVIFRSVEQEPPAITKPAATNAAAPALAVATSAGNASTGGAPDLPQLQESDVIDVGQAMEEASTIRRETRCFALSQLDLAGDDWRKVNRYLDVTKSALLFGGRVILLEGIAEALLLPVIAKNFVLKGNADAWRRFRSAVYIPIDGVDFAPYINLLLTQSQGVRIASQLVIVTDGDAHKLKKADLAQSIQPGAQPAVVSAAALPLGRRRKKDFRELAGQLGATAILGCYINRYSLESALVAAGNGDLLKRVFLKHKPLSSAQWDAAVAKTGLEQAAAIQKLFEDTRKGDFAQSLAAVLESEDGKDFRTPRYLSAAIRALIR